MQHLAPMVLRTRTVSQVNSSADEDEPKQYKVSRFRRNIPDDRFIVLQSANAIFARVGRIASEEVVLHLMSTKCIPILLYGLEACPLRKTDLNSLDFVVNRFL